jgi:hypothetical protein
MELPKDRSGKTVQVGSRVRLVQLSGKWLDDLPIDERPRVLSMVGEVFEVEEIDGYGSPWISKEWRGEGEERCVTWSHSIALDPSETELVGEPTSS